MTAPKLRFKEFDGDWQNIKLDSFVSFSKGKGISKADISEDGKNYCIRYGELYTTYGQVINKIISKTHIAKSESILSKAGDVIIPASGETQIDIATASCVLQSDIILSGDLNILSHSENGEWLAYYLSSAKKLDIAQLAQGNSVVHLYSSQLKNLLINKPSKEEQTKIASFLSAVDEKISQLNQKHSLLSQYKQGMMQKLFSQQIRFKADDGSEFGEWENKTISEIAFYRRGSFPQPYGLPEWLDKNGFPFVQVYDVADNMLLKDKTKIKISQLAANQSVLAKAGTLIITLQGSIGRVAKMQYDAYVDRTLLIFQSYMMPINTDYFKYALYLLFNVEKEKADGGIIKTITKETLSKFDVGVPCLEEQTKIANFLSAIDQKIEVVAQQIEHAKQWKKGVLQQMFV